MSILIGRAINRNQLLILHGIKTSRRLTVTSVLNKLSLSYNVALSTLKSNLKVLESMRMVHWKRGKAVGLTSFGERVLRTVESNGGLGFNSIKSLMMV